MLTDVQGEIKFLITNSDSTLQIYMKFAFIVTCLVFLDSEWITDNVSSYSESRGQKTVKFHLYALS